MDLKKSGFATKAVHAGQHPDKETGALVQPMYLTSTFVFTPEKADRYFSGDKAGIFTYGRSRNPTQNIFQEKVAALEGADSALATASGMAAITNAIMSFVHSGDHIISCKTVYGGTYALFTKIFKEFNIEVTFVPKLSVEELNKAVKPNTKLVYMESILNPTLEVTNVPEVVAWAKAKGIKTMVDNTFTTPYLFRPLELGVDVVVHSTTKYLNGHGDHVGGIIVGDAEFIESVRSGVYQEFGPVPSPFAMWLGIRGVKTLHLRMKAHCENAMVFAKWLETNKHVEKVIYPGLEEVRSLTDHLNMAYYAVSLGDLDTLVEHPATMTHGKIAPEERLEMGIPDGLIRVSVGIEDVNDIIADFDQALNYIK